MSLTAPNARRPIVSPGKHFWVEVQSGWETVHQRFDAVEFRGAGVREPFEDVPESDTTDLYRISGDVLRDVTRLEE
jgi:hypothetical protein